MRLFQWLWRRFSDAVQAWQLWLWFSPGAVSAVTALLAQAQGLPAYQIVMAAVNVFAFMCLGVASIFHGVLRYDEMKARLNPRDKLKLEPSFWITKGGPDNSLIEEMQLGFDVKNTAQRFQ